MLDASFIYCSALDLLLLASLINTHSVSAELHFLPTFIHLSRSRALRYELINVFGLI